MQDWIGLVMAPSVDRYVRELGLDLARRGDYVCYDVPVKVKKVADGTQQRSASTERLFARRLAKDNRAEAAIEQMWRESESQCTNEDKKEIRAKYDNTLSFIRSTRLRSEPSVRDARNTEVRA